MFGAERQYNTLGLFHLRYDKWNQPGGVDDMSYIYSIQLSRFRWLETRCKSFRPKNVLLWSFEVPLS